MVGHNLSDVRESIATQGILFKMEELALLNLLECPLCFKQLDVSAKVLPCQHTFCKSCLQRQEASRSQLLCPECRTPARARSVEELPANLSLVPLLEGLRDSMGPGRGRQSGRYMVPSVRDGSTVREGHNRERQGHTEVSVWPTTEDHLLDNDASCISSLDISDDASLESIVFHNS